MPNEFAVITSHQTLVSPEWLESHLSRVHVLEVSMKDDDIGYRDGHIPGAVFSQWRQLCWHSTDRRFTDPSEAAQHLGLLGISEAKPLVIYGDPVQFGVYAYWVLHAAGVADVRLLDGGKEAWVAQGRELSVAVPAIHPVAHQSGQAAPLARVSRDEVSDHLHDSGWLLLDVRSPEEFAGERVSPATEPVDHGAQRAGHIPGARHLDFRLLLNGDGTFRTPNEIRASLADVGWDGKSSIVTYCRLAHRASLAWYAFTAIAGIADVRVYDGSWTEWGSLVDVPIERDTHAQGL